MADLAFPTLLVTATPSAPGRASARFTTTQVPPQPLRSLDRRHLRTTTGTISDQVVLKTSATTEIPFANARIWLLRAADGYKAWEGWSDATGHYTATGLEIGVEYVPVALDPTRTHKTTAAGPVASA